MATRPAKGLPFVYINVATTADGKLAPANRHFEPFSGKRDQTLLLELRARADAVISGARTIDSTAVTLGPGGSKYRAQRRRRGLAEYNLRVIASGEASVDPESEIFKHRFSPIIILTTKRAPKRRVERLRKLADDVVVFGKDEIDFVAALKWLRRKWKVKRLLCEGGGELNGSLFRAGVVNQIYITLCPLILGGRNAPTAADGPNAKRLSEAIPLRLKSMRRVGAEQFLVYDVLNRS
jgi:riboflavin-specific deaminase-like protein